MGVLSFNSCVEPVECDCVLFLQGMATAEAEDLLADQTDETAFLIKETKKESSMTIVGGSNWKPREKSWVSPCMNWQETG